MKPQKKLEHFLTFFLAVSILKAEKRPVSSTAAFFVFLTICRLYSDVDTIGFLKKGGFLGVYAVICFVKYLGSCPNVIDRQVLVLFHSYIVNQDLSCQIFY